MKNKPRLLILILGFLIIVWLGSSIIRGIIILITKNSLGNTTITLLVFVLTFILILLLIKFPPFKKLDNELNSFLKKYKN